jgi:HEAT repeat protein
MTRANPPLVLPLTFALVLATLGGCSKPAAPPASPAAGPKSKPAKVEEKAALPEDGAAPESAKDASSPDSSLAELINTLTTTDDSRTRVITADAIATRRRAALPALNALVAALDDPEPRVRWHAARAIGLIGHEAASAVPALVKLLSDDDPVTVTQAASAIGHIRRDDDRPEIPAADAAIYSAAIEPLVGVMVHADPRARRAAVRAIGELSTSREQLLAVVKQHLADADPMAVMPALHTLADMGKDAVPFLIEALQDPASRFWAEVVLAELGPDAAAAAEPLAKLAEKGDIEDRVQSILALARMGDAAKVAAPQLAAALESPDASLRYVAAYALGQLKLADGDAALEKAATSDDPFLVTLAVWARARIHPENTELRDHAFDLLGEAVTDESPEVRRAGVEGLSEIDDALDKPQRLHLADTFVGLLADPDPAVSLAAGAGLIRLGPDAVDALVSILATPGVRQAGMEILAALGPAALPALDPMIAGLNDTDPVYRANSALAIAAIGAEAKEAVEGLASLLADEAAPAEARYTAAFALGRIGPDAKAANPLLRTLADDKDEIMATVAVWAALKIQPDDTSLFDVAIPKLRHTLTKEREMARLEAAVALGEIGPRAATAIPLLEMLAEEDPSRDVRAAAARALKRIRKPD